MKRAASARRKLATLIVGIGLMSPSAVAASSSDTFTNELQTSQEMAAQSQASELVRTMDGEQMGDMSTNCDEVATPFLRGTVRDAEGNPVAGAMVSAKLLGQTFPNPYQAGPFVAWQTKADGTYSICSWDSNFRNTLAEADPSNKHAIVVVATPPVSSSGTTMGSRIDLLSYIPATPSPLKTPTTAQRSADCLDPALNTSSSCTVNFTLSAPTVTAKAKAASGAVMPRSRFSLEFLYGGTSPYAVWTTLAEGEMNSTGDFGMSGFRQNNSFRFKVQPPWCSVEESGTCPFNDFGSVTDSLAVTVPTQGVETGGSGTWGSTSGSHRDFTLTTANFKGAVKDGLGTPITDDIVQITATKGSTTIQESSQYDGSFKITLADGTWSVVVSGQSYMIGTDATYTVVVAGNVVTSVSLGDTTVCSSAGTACGAALSLGLTPPNFLGTVKDDAGTVVKGASVNLQEYNSSLQGWPWTGRSWQESGDPTSEWNPREAGIFGFSLTADKIYRIELGPPWNSDSEVVRTTYFVKAVADGSGIKVQRCAEWDGNPSVTPCATGFTNSTLTDSANTLVKTANRYTLAMKTANFKAIACAPGSGCTAVPNGSMNLMKYQVNPCQGCGGYYSGTNNWATSSQSGLFSMSITTEGTYRLEMQTPYASSENATDPSLLYAKTTLDFVADEVNGTMKYFTVDSSGAATTTELPTTSVTDRGSRIVARYQAPSFIAIVKTPDGTLNSNASVQIQKDSATQNCPSCREWLGHSQINNNGIFTLAPKVGKHYLTVYASWELQAQNYTSTEFKMNVLDCNSDGTVEVYTFTSVCGQNPTELTKVDGKVLITLQGANFTGVLKKPDGDQAVIQNTDVQIEKWTACDYCGQSVSGRWEWTNKNAFIRQDGKFAINFSEAGRYRATFNAPSAMRAQYSSSRMIIDVTGTSSMTVTPETDTRVWSADGSGGYIVKLSLPNVSGTVTKPNASAATSTWIQVEKWDANLCGEGCYTWTPEFNGVSTNSTGDYAMTMPQGRWRIMFNPPYGDTTSAKATREIVVTSSLDVCLLSNSTSNSTACATGTTIAPGALDIQLPSPNFSGTVKNPDTTVSRNTSIRFETWNSSSNFWQWANLPANTDNNGTFGVNLTQNETYRVTFEPGWTTSGVSALVVYVRVCGGGTTVELKADEAAAKTGTTCSGSGTLNNPATQYNLLGSNMRGTVLDGTVTPAVTLGDVWVGLLNCGYGRPGNFDDNCSWERGVNTKNFGDTKGMFDFKLSNDGSRNVTKYRVEVNPPWNSTSGLVRAQYEIWVKNFDGNASNGDEWCLSTDYTDSNFTDTTAGTCSNPRNGGGANAWSITLAAGNLAGKVLDPTGTTAIANSWIQVEKWNTQPWNSSQYFWEWTSTSASSSQQGSFGLNITDAGLYRLTVNPGWDNPNGYARNRIYVRVEAGTGNWCVRSGGANYSASDATPDSAQSCTYGRDNEADSVTGLTLKLVGANLAGILYTSSANLSSSTDLGNANLKVRDAWMTLQKKRTESSYIWWEWLGGSNTAGSASSKGQFAFRLDADGDYRLEVQPSWQSTGGDAQFYVYLTVSNCSTTCSVAVTGSPTNVVTQQNGSLVMKYPAPNFVGTVFGKKTGSPLVLGSKIAGAWLSVMDNSTGEWVAGVSTGWNGSNQGKFSLKLADGTYRVDVNPRWDDSSNGMRRQLTVTVSGGVVTSCSTGCEANGSSYDIDLLGETLSGKVYYPGTADTSGDAYASATSGIQTVMPWAWAEAFSCSDAAGTQCSTRVDGQGANQRGVLQFGLAGQANPYLVQVYPNWSVYPGAPLRLLVKIDPTTLAVTWKYEGESGGYTSDAFTPDFGHIPPNVTVTVSGATDSRFVDLYKCSGGSDASCTGGTWVLQVTTQSKDDSGTQKATFNVTSNGDYRVVVIRRSGETNASAAVALFTYSGSNITRSVSVS